MEAIIGTVQSRRGNVLRVDTLNETYFVHGNYAHLKDGAPVVLLTDSINFLVVASKEYYRWFESEVGE